MSGPAFLDLLDALAAGGRDVAALHSAADGRWSVVGADPVLTMEFSEEGVARWIAHGDLQPPPIKHGGGILETFDAMMASVDLGDVVTDAQSDCAVTPGKPGAIRDGAPLGWMGWVGYDIGRHLENVGHAGHDDMHWPLLRWTLFASYFVLDHQTMQWSLMALDTPGDTPTLIAKKLDRMVRILSAIHPADDLAPSAPGEIVGQLSRSDYCNKVQRVIDYIGAGDVYQVNLAQRWAIDAPQSPAQIFRHLCHTSPAPYAAFFRFGNRAMASASPELFIDRRGRQLQTRPIKGTRPRHPHDPAADERLRRELWESPKDQAELAMIVDLLRNDLGRICEFKTVQVIQPRQMEAHPTVWHTVATIQGQLRRTAAGWGSILAALCPGGSITGAPKIRAMQIITKLEEFRRGLYCGNIGWIGPQGDGALNIAIRTILLETHAKGCKAWVWAGGGIVADSTPEAEYEETLHKAAALCKALGLAVL